MQRTAALASAALRCLAAASARPSIPARAFSAISRRPNPLAARLFLPPVFDHSRGYARRASKTPAPRKDDDDEDGGGDEDDDELIGEDDFDSDGGDWSEFPDEDDDSYDSEPGTYNTRKRR